jgi:hypothetical protein
MTKLTYEDQAFVDNFDKQFKSIIDTLEKAKQFKLDDYLVLYVSDARGVMQLKNNSYGAPVKYKVVYVNSNGIPFIKQVNKKGNPIGNIFSCVGSREDTFRSMEQTFEFMLDPDFADSILLQDQYDPAHLHRSKKDIWKAVTEHNKACKVPTHQFKDVLDFVRSVNVGDTVWTSNISYFLIQDKKALSPVDFNKTAKSQFRTSSRGPFVTVLTLRDKKGKIKVVPPDFFCYKAIYRERPRTYKELNI